MVETEETLLLKKILAILEGTGMQAMHPVTGKEDPMGRVVPLPALAAQCSPDPTAIQWTLSKTDLIELIYALHNSSAFNKGKVTIAHIVRAFEQCFHIRLGNTSMTFQEILRRKSSTVFLDRLKDNLELHIERIDEKHFKK
ncbi:MAG TPA: RteC domain-containing protein [Sediminibacterium sp.]